MLIDGAVDGIDEGSPDTLGWYDGCELREELGIELGTVLIDGTIDGIDEGRGDALGDSEVMELGLTLLGGLIEG